MFKSKNNIHRTLFIIITMLVLLSCNLGSGSSETAPDVQADDPEEVVVADEEEDPVRDTTSNAVASLEDVKTAVIQIEAQGTFVDPEFGEYSGAGRGSGFIIDPSGLAVTNNHVVTGAALLKVWIGGDITETYNAQIIAVSECSDLALIDIEGDNFPYLEWHSDPIQVGLEVYAAGFPLGDPEYTLTKGIVSKEKADGESSWASVNQVIEHDATINPGNSGGPLVSEDGQAVGVNYATYAQANQYFAIGRDTTLPIIEQFKTGEDVDTVGINGMAVMSDDGTLSGIWVSSVRSGSAADKAGLEPGDLITTLENLPLAVDGSMADYCDIIRTQGDENTLAMEVLRYPTMEVLEGQFNGQALAVVGTSGPVINEKEPADDDTGPQQGDPSDVLSEYIVEVYDDGYMSIVDDYSALIIDVPVNWNQIDGTVWEDYWGDLYFVAARVIAAPDIDGFLTSYDYSGVRFSASRDWGAIGGYIQLLDGVKYWYEDDCTLEYREEYEDSVYEGAYDFWECSRGNSANIVIGARPMADPTAYLALVEIQVVTDADIDAMERIMDTFDLVDGYLP
ncbi:MAG: trypsin-like peptidase domain-containing protein [Anaerolineales bacterium]